MTLSDPGDFDPALDERAAEWLLEREEGFAPGREAAFARWRDEDPRHAAAVTAAEETLGLLDELPEFPAPLAARLNELPRETEATSVAGLHRKHPKITWLAGLGGLAAALVLGFALWPTSVPRPPEGERYAAGLSAQRSLVLPDGSVLDLNTGTAVVVRFTASERRILLSQGEAHFQVAHDASRPFTVSAAAISVRAVGTAFNVRLAGQGIDVLVDEGRVELGQSSVPATKPFGEAAPLLAAGERAQLASPAEAASPRIEKMNPRELHALLNWQNPLTSFAEVPLRDVVARFNRRNATQLILADADLGDRRIGGMIALDQVDAFVRLLERDGDIVADRAVPEKIALRHAR